MRSPRPPLVLLILDGWGLRDDPDHNAIALAPTPTYDALRARYPGAALVTSGAAVGLPPGQMGNSEVGHMNLGAGRIVYQDLTRIDQSIEDGTFFANPPLARAMDRCTTDRHALHLVGLVSDGGVHSHRRHLEALLTMAARRRVARVFVHALTDGRDASPTAGAEVLGAVDRTMQTVGAGRLATVSGRYFAMDRDRRWDRTQRAYECLTAGRGGRATTADGLLAASYAAGVTDEFVEPTVLVDAHESPVGLIADGDSVVCFNYRADRMRQLTRALGGGVEFDGFERRSPPGCALTTMTEYDAHFALPVAFPPQTFSATVTDVLTDAGLTNLRLAETEKYAHVTYFFNCGIERARAGEDRTLVPSPRVATYDLEPAMRAHEITARLVADLRARRHDVIICNFANADMVGHTGQLGAAVEAVAALDDCLAAIVTAVESAEGTVVLTADHGNAETMWDAERGCPHTAHTANPVPVLLVERALRDSGRKLRDGSLRDVAPTLLGILGLDPPAAMSGRDLRPWVAAGRER